MEGDRKVVNLNVDDILPNRFQPRIKFDEDEIQSLSDSIKRHGVIQPIIVRPIADKYEIIAGERRYKATLLANLPTIPAIILKLNDKDSAEIALIENVQRQDLTPMEEAITYKKVLDMGYTQNELAQKLGVKQSTISNKLRLLNLCDEVQDALLENKISERHARSLLKLKDEKEQEQMLERIINERLTVKRTDEEIKKVLEKPQDTIEVLDFDMDFEDTKKEKGENDMNNNDPMNQFNIPTPSILEDTNEKTVLPTNVEPTVESNRPPVDLLKPQSEIPTNNPGFMDIDRIESQAQDIGGPSSFNESAPRFFKLPEQEKPVENTNPTFSGNVFSQAPENNLNSSSGVNQNIGNPFQNTFNGNGSNTVVEPQGPAPMGNSFNIPEIPSMPNPSVQAEPGIPEVPTMASIPETPSMSTTEASKEPVVSGIPVVPNIGTSPVIPEVPSMPTMEAPKEPVASEIPTVLSVELSNIPSVEPMNISDNSTISETKNTNSAPMGNPFDPQKKNLTSVIQEIRSIKNSFENQGYIIDLEEMDLAGEYQITIHIKK